jgi:hypothetical protein
VARDLGGFTTVADRKTAGRAATLSGGLVAAAGAAAALRLGNYPMFLGVIAVALVVYFVHRRVALSRMRKGTLDVEDDAELGVVLTLRRDGPGVRVPLSKATMIGRGRKLATVGLVRLQIEVTWEGRSICCNLAVPVRPAEGDVEGIAPAQYDLDRTASRALDALSYEVKELAKDGG